MSGRFFVTNQGEVNGLTTMLVPGRNLIFKLFQSATLVTDATVLADLTEADYSGYSEQTVILTSPASADSFAGLVNLKALSGTYSAIFPGSSGSDQTVYGVYVMYSDISLGNTFLGAANCFDANPTLSLAGKTISGSSDVTPIAFNLRLWDYFTGQAVPPGVEHFALWADQSFVNLPDLGPVGICDRLGDESFNTTSTRTATFTSTDPSAVLPADFDFTGTGGIGTVTVTWVTTGTQTLTATDTSDGTILGKITLLIEVT